jgi:tRNA-dihydrouridine synthase B
LIGNGDITTPQAVVEAFRRYDIDGVMIGRAALNRPWLFRQAQAALRGESIPPDPSLEQQRQMMIEHFDLLIGQFGPRQATVLMRKFACCYANGRPGARAFRANVGKVATPQEFHEIVERYFPREVNSTEAAAVFAGSGDEMGD